MKLKITVFLVVFILLAATAVYADYSRVLSVPPGGVVFAECDGGDSGFLVKPGFGKTLILTCQGTR